MSTTWVYEIDGEYHKRAFRDGDGITAPVISVCGVAIGADDDAWHLGWRAPGLPCGGCFPRHLDELVRASEDAGLYDDQAAK